MSNISIEFRQLLVRCVKLSWQLNLTKACKTFQKTLDVTELRPSHAVDLQGITKTARKMTLLSGQTFRLNEALDLLFFAVAQLTIDQNFYEFLVAVTELYDQMDPNGEGAQLERCMIRNGLEFLNSSGGRVDPVSLAKEHHAAKHTFRHLSQPGMITSPEKVLQLRKNLQESQRPQFSDAEVDRQLWNQMMKAMHIPLQSSLSTMTGPFEKKLDAVHNMHPLVLQQYSYKFCHKSGGPKEMVITDARGKSVSIRTTEVPTTPGRDGSGVLSTRVSATEFLLNVAKELNMLKGPRVVKTVGDCLELYGCWSSGITLS